MQIPLEILRKSRFLNGFNLTLMLTWTEVRCPPHEGELPLSASTWALMPRCVVCDTRRVRGLGWYCGRCGHGGHLDCMTRWFAQAACCPTGCGCRCAEAYAPSFTDSDESLPSLPPPAEPPALRTASTHRLRQAVSGAGTSGRTPGRRHRRGHSQGGSHHPIPMAVVE